MVPIQTPKGRFRVWTKRVGHHPRIRLLLLHGGPGATHEYFEAFESFLPQAGIEFIYYDQLGSAYSDQPDDPSLVELPRYVDEVEQVRQALGLGPKDFYLLGHSWGGILALEYALAHPQQLKGLVISNMVASIPEYNRYAHEVLMPAMDPAALQQILALEQAGRFEDPQYEALLMLHYYVQHVLRLPADQWPEPVLRSFSHLNRKIYVPMQGPSEMGASGQLERWDRMADLPKIQVPTLAIGAQHDTMEPAQMRLIAQRVRRGRYLHCPQGPSRPCGWLPQLHLVPFRVDHPAELAVLGIVGFLQHLTALFAQGLQQRVQVGHPVVHHEGRRARRKLLTALRPDGPGRGAGHRLPGRIRPIKRRAAPGLHVNAQMALVPGAQGHRVLGLEEDAPDTRHTLHRRLQGLAQPASPMAKRMAPVAKAKT